MRKTKRGDKTSHDDLSGRKRGAEKTGGETRKEKKRKSRPSAKGVKKRLKPPRKMRKKG